MKLLEHKGKELLAKSGITIPKSILVNNKTYANLSYGKEKYRQFFDEEKNVVVKAQVLGGSRKKAGVIFIATDYEKSLKQIEELYAKKYNNAIIDTLLIEEKLEIEKEYFLSILYDTWHRRPMILFSQSGGIEIESNDDKITKFYPAKVAKLTKQEALEITDNQDLADFLMKSYQAFIDFDCSHLEINPIILTPAGALYAGDAKLTIDDGAVPRQEILSDVADSDEKTRYSPREIEARKIDLEDHRGVAGKTFVDLDGDIAVLASGGGASLTCMDALIEAGGAPANYTEYSGNPPREKVAKLTKLTLEREGLNGCLVIGGTANFTDIFETLSGFVDGLKSLPQLPKYPIVIRRAGPRDKEAFVMLKNFAASNSLDVTLFGEETPMSYAAKTMAEKVKKYKVK